MTSRAAPSRAYLVLWAVFPVLVPFYLMGTPRTAPQLAGDITPPPQLTLKIESGVPQIADYWMATLMLLVFAGIGIFLWRRFVPTVFAFAAFAAYALAVNLVWTVMVREPELPFLRSSLFYLYDLLLFVVVLVLYSCFGRAFLRVTLYAIAASVFLQVLLSPFAVDRMTFRQSLHFNNPNQLGYYAVLAGTVFYLCTLKIRVNPVLQVCVYTAVGYLAVVSLSKAALLALGALFVLVMLNRMAMLLLGGLALGAALLMVKPPPPGLGHNLGYNLERRIETEDADESFAKRGYDRILNHPEYLLFGAGEGANYRFISEHPGEMHSSWGTVLFSYGILGAGLFAYGLWVLVRHVPLRAGLALLPVLLYGSAHQGLRFTLFWVFLGVLCALKEPPKDTA